MDIKIFAKTIEPEAKAQVEKMAASAVVAQAEVAKTKAQAEADVKVIEAQAEAESNRIIAESITPELIQMMEAQARQEHGWVTVQGADAVVVQDK